MVLHERNFTLSMEMSFFVVCPLRNCECKTPKIGMNCNQSLTILFPFDSSRFSGQISRISKGITKKDISMLFCIEFLRRLFLFFWDLIGRVNIFVVYLVGPGKAPPLPSIKTAVIVTRDLISLS